MPFLKTSSFALNDAQQFILSVSGEAGSNTKYYMTLGKVDPWANDANPPVVVNSIDQQYDVWRNMFAGKRILATDISMVIPRINWAANTVYSQYDNESQNLTNYYVLSSGRNIYKCLFNNNGANSIFEPSYTLTDTTQTTLDNYIWKFMYSLQSGDLVKFFTDDWMAVDELAVPGSSQEEIEENAVPGSIDVVLIGNGGRNYANLANIVITLTGDGSDALCTVTTNATNSIVNAVMSLGGSGYTFANIAVTDLGGTGTGAVLRPIISPPGGHGSNPARELGAGTVMITSRIQGTEEGQIPATSKYRQISIVKNPLFFGLQNVSSNIVVNQCVTVSVSGVSVDFQVGEIVYQGSSFVDATFMALVVSWDSTNLILQIANPVGTLNPETIIGATSLAARFVVASENPDLTPYSGDILYVDNIIPVQRDPNQTENIQTIIDWR